MEELDSMLKRKLDELTRSESEKNQLKQSISDSERFYYSFKIINDINFFKFSFFST